MSAIKLFLLTFSICALCSAGTIVPGTSDIWLAGMPNGSTASTTDTAPGQSPVQVGGLALTPGGTLKFSVTGAVSNGSCCAPVGPDGGVLIGHDAGAENGIANVYAPINALMGVFLGPSQPNLTPAPGLLDFSGAGYGLDFPSLSPELKQPFFIGDGFTAAVAEQLFVIPAGATRFYLGTMDGYEWINNFGSFEVDVTETQRPQEEVPEPATFMLLGAALAGLTLLRRRCS